MRKREEIEKDLLFSYTRGYVFPEDVRMGYKPRRITHEELTNQILLDIRDLLQAKQKDVFPELLK